MMKGKSFEASGRNRKAPRRSRMLRRAAVTALAAAMTFALCVPAFAAGSPDTYTVRIYSGQRGRIDGGELVLEQEYAAGANERVTFDALERVQTTADNEKYYVKGIRESGKDYKEEMMASPSFEVTRDIDYVVAYGIKGDSVAYTVNYLDADGNALLESRTYYGNVGDAPVIAYQYIEGWLPQAYNLTRTLSDNAADNVFDFVYTQTAGAVAEEAGGADAGAGAAGAGAGAGAAGAGAGAGGVAVPDEATPQDLLNLDDEETPLANIGEGIKNLVDPDGDGLLVNIPKPLIGTGLAVIAFLLILIALWSRKKKKEYESNE